MGLFRKKQHEQVRQPSISDQNEAYAFRRSRTMTGSLSNEVRSATEQHAGLRSERLKHHDLKHTRRRIVWLLVGCLAAAGVIYGLLGQFIASVTISPTTLSSDQQAAYKQAIHDYLGAHPGERFYATLNRDALTSFVQTKHAEVQQIVVESGGFLVAGDATITLRTAVAVWTLHDKRYYIDEHGVAFTTAPSVQPSLIVEDNTGIDPADASAVASERMIRYIGRLVALVQQGGFTITKVELPANTSRQVVLYLEGRGYPMRTHLDRDAAAQAADVVNAVKYFDSKGLRPEYIDVRVSSKAFYK